MRAVVTAQAADEDIVFDANGQVLKVRVDPDDPHPQPPSELTPQQREAWADFFSDPENSNPTAAQPPHAGDTTGRDQPAKNEQPGRQRGDPVTRRTVQLEQASNIEIRPVHWLWDNRIALGILVLLGGREGIGKSTFAYWLAAMITRGQLPGKFFGQPKAVIIAATEDSWEHTIVPRLIGAGADLEKVYRIDVVTPEGVETAINLPYDLAQLEQSVSLVGAALILLDPLMSRLDASLDTHKDSEVRQALEPLVSVGNRSGAAVLGIIHVNKSKAGDPLSSLMGSRAFAAVARAVLFVMKDPDDERIRLLGQPKNNLGSIELPTMSFTIEGKHVADTPEGAVGTGVIVWGEDRQESILDSFDASSEAPDVRSATLEAADWLREHLMTQGLTDDSASVKAAGQKAGHSASTLKRAIEKIGGTITMSGYPRRSFWTITEPPANSRTNSRGESFLGPTEPNGQQSDRSDQQKETGGPGPTEVLTLPGINA